MHTKTILLTVILMTYFLVSSAGEFSLHFVIESLLSAIICELIYVHYKLFKLHKLYVSLSENMNTTHKQLYEDANNIIKILQQEQENSAIGVKYYLSDSGSKVHSTKECDVLTNKKIKQIVLNDTILKIFKNCDKFCKKCQDVKPQNLGVEVYSAINGQKIYENLNLVSSQHRENVFKSLITYDEYMFLHEKFPDVLVTNFGTNLLPN